jgi:hypothetical protein
LVSLRFFPQKAMAYFQHLLAIGIETVKLVLALAPKITKE